MGEVHEFAAPERLTVHVQTKLMPTEQQRLVQIRDELHAQGHTDITLSAIVRTFILAGMQQYRADQAQDEPGASDPGRTGERPL